MPNEYLNQLNFQSILIVGQVDPEVIIKHFEVTPGESRVLNGAEIKITDLRELISWLNFKPMAGGTKLAIIQNADQIATEASNTLLKTLEEPPSYAKIVLTTLNEQRILATIQSRCQKVRLTGTENRNLPEIYLDPQALHNLTMKERFTWAAQVSELAQDEVNAIFTAWQITFREKLLAGSDQISVLKEISRAKALLETNISLKLLLENLLLNF